MDVTLGNASIASFNINWTKDLGTFQVDKKSTLKLGLADTIISTCKEIDKVVSPLKEWRWTPLERADWRHGDQLPVQPAIDRKDVRGRH